jgi:hypothetical protein
LLQQSETTLKELSIVVCITSDFSKEKNLSLYVDAFQTFPRFNENTSFYQPCSDGSMNILRLIEPFDTFNNKKKMFKLQKLKSLHIQGSNSEVSICNGFPMYKSIKTILFFRTFRTSLDANFKMH